MNLRNVKDELILVNNTTLRRKILHVLLILVLIFFYILCGQINVSLTYQPDNYYFSFLGVFVNKYTLSGLVAQGQVISAILITLNPLKRSGLIALMLCLVSSISSFLNVLNTVHADSLPGVIIPITTAVVCLIISNYGKRLKDQLDRVVNYSRIVKKNEEMLHSLAYYDVLTGLPNRKMMMDQIEILIDKKKSEGEGFYLVYLDLDNFKKINDTMGHSVGDIILKNVAERWKQQCHNDDMLARVSGDEFVIIIRHKFDKIQLTEYLDRFKNVLKDPVIIGRKDFNISASSGITKYPEDGKDAEELLKNADIALYKAKYLGKNDFQFFDISMQEETTKKIRLENDLLSAIRKNELYMVYQPQYVCDTKKLRGFEALIRWKHPELGIISPMEFIPIAEEDGFIVEMGSWIIETVLNKFKELNALCGIDVIVSINISVKQMLDPSFIATVKEILERTGYNSRFIEFEITESVFISCPEYVIGVINQLKSLGIRIALDDFGTGYASLNYLQMLPINILKIDKTFLDKINLNDTSGQMAGAIITLSHKLGIEVVAEGVEVEEQLRYLNDQRCDYIQGYLLSKPIGEEQVERLYKDSLCTV